MHKQSRPADFELMDLFGRDTAPLALRVLRVVEVNARTVFPAFELLEAAEIESPMEGLLDCPNEGRLVVCRRGDCDGARGNDSCPTQEICDVTNPATTLLADGVPLSRVTRSSICTAREPQRFAIVSERVSRPPSRESSRGSSGEACGWRSRSIGMRLDRGPAQAGSHFVLEQQVGKQCVIRIALRT